jgi:hypothetical protein
MSTTAMRILEQFRELPAPERRELIQALLQEANGLTGEAPSRRHLDEVLGKFTPLPAPDIKDHNDALAEAILASKRGGEEP